MRVRGYAALYSSALLFALTSLLVKLCSRYFPVLFVSAARFAIGTLLCLLALAIRYRSVKPVRPGLLAIRGFFGVISMSMSYAAISLTGPGRATLLSNTYPLFVLVFGAVLFRERFELRTLASIAICTAGAVFVMRDGSGAALAGDLLALGSAVFAGIAVNVVRKATQFDNPFQIYLSPCLYGLSFFTFTGPGAGFESGGAIAAILLVAMGVCTFSAQSFMAYGYRTVPAGRGSVVFYLETALTVLLGLLFAAERFNLRFGAGLALIFGGLALNQFGRASKRVASA